MAFIYPFWVPPAWSVVNASAARVFQSPISSLCPATQNLFNPPGPCEEDDLMRLQDAFGALWGFWLCRGALGGCAIDVMDGIGVVVHLCGWFTCLWRCAGARLGALSGEEGFVDVKAE